MRSERTGLNDGQWHHVGVSYSEESGKQIFIDTQLDSTRDYLGAVGTGALRYGFIGDGSEATNYNGNRNNLMYDGRIADVNLWNTGNNFSLIGNPLNLSTSVPIPSSSGLLGLALVSFFIRRKTIKTKI